MKDANYESGTLTKVMTPVAAVESNMSQRERGNDARA